MNQCYRIIIKFFSWFSTLLFVIIVGVSRASAWTSDGGITYEGVAYLTDSTTVSIQADYDTPGGGTLELQPNTTYQTRIKKLFIEVEGYNFVANRQYQLELHFEGIQLNQNANTYKVYAWNTATLSNDLCMISYEETIMSSDAYPRWNFQCPNTSSDIVIHVYNSNDSAITQTGAFRWSYSYLWYSNQSIGSGNDDIIDNSNQNADRIINNQNENTDKMIESQKVCSPLPIYNKFSYVNSNGNLSSSNYWNSSDYIDVTSGNLKYKSALSSNGDTYYCFYNSSKQKMTCTLSPTSSNGNISIPDGASYFRFSNTLGGEPIYYLCKDGNQAISDDLKDLNDSITDDTPPDISSLSNMAGWLPPGPVDSVLNLPFTFYNSLNSALSGTCSSVSISLPFVSNQTLVLPCFSTYMSQYLSNFNTLWSLIGVVASVVILYRYLLSLYVWVDGVLTLRYELHESLGGNSANFGGV